ncbi:MAG: endonuclease NucS [Sulfolobales archaeon]
MEYDEEEGIYRTIDHRKLESVREIIAKSMRNSVVIIIGRCSVIYKGRASSETGYDVRMIIIKPDGTLLVHEAVGRDPLNWQPPGSLCTLHTQDHELLIRCYRSKYREEVLIRFDKLYHVGVARIGYSRYFEVKGVEKDLVNMIASSSLPIDPEARLISREYHTPHGRIDLLFKNYSRNILYVVEVKNERAGVAAVDQLRRYVEYMRNHYREGSVAGVLIAGGISDEALKELLSQGFYYIDSKNLKPSDRKDLYEYLRGGGSEN